MLDFLKTKDNKEPKSKQKQLENIVVFIIILIITVLIINNIMKSDKKEAKDNETDTSKVLASTENASSEENLEERLADILESIAGVGKVKVLIKYSETSSIVPIYNETTSESKTEETDSDGGNKNTVQTDVKKEIVYSDENGNSQIITKKVDMPVIEGAIITAQGASNSNIKASIVSAVEAITGLATHKIQVFEMNN